MKKFAAFMFFMLLLAGCGTAEQAKQGEQTDLFLKFIIKSDDKNFKARKMMRAEKRKKKRKVLFIILTIIGFIFPAFLIFYHLI